MHGNQPILGFRFGPMAYLTDVSAIPEDSLEKLQNLDVLVLNALRIEPHHSHLNLESALAYIEQINPKTTYLIHISHLLGLHDTIEKQLPEGIHLAIDGMTFAF
jgi:phosphoribosyl 1,2-cyclic phosphate phosphodiesterase